MSAVLTREQLRQRIDQLEALETIMAAIDDVSGVEFEAGEQHALDLHISARDMKKSPVASAYALPPEIVLAGLQAMRGKLEAEIASFNANTNGSAS